MAARVFEKVEGASKDYNVIWADWLQPNESIATSAWTIPAGLTGGAESINTASAVTFEGTEYRVNTVATVYISGGKIGQIYELINTITSDAGRIDSRSLFIQVVRRYTGQ